MKDRDDALAGVGRNRLEELTGEAISRALDPALQRIVEEAARVTGAPISLVSLLLEHTQFFRAHHGLPPELAAAQATDRDVSFCQYVVSTELPLEVTDAAVDARVPQHLVTRFGIRAYLGTPVRVGRQVVGSLCVIDTAPRTFSAEALQQLQALAVLASERLTQLALEHRGTVRQRLLSRAASPLFNELRNVLGPLRSDLAFARSTAVEFVSLLELINAAPAKSPEFERAFGALEKTAGSGAELQAALGAMVEAVTRIEQNIFALEATVLSAPGEAPVERIIQAANQLSHHVTKLVGGVDWQFAPTVATVRTPPSIAISALAMILLELSEELVRARRRGLSGTVRAGERVVVALRANELTTEGTVNTFGRLRAALSEELSFDLACEEGEILLSFERGS